MIQEPRKLVAARAALAQAERDLGDPGGLSRLRNAIDFLLQELSGVSPQIERDIAKKLILTSRNKVLSEAKVILANFDSYETGFLEYWNEVMEVFVDARLAADAQFNACKEQLLTRRARQSDNLITGSIDMPKREPLVGYRQDDLCLGPDREVRTMVHAKSLRVIGQSLEMLRLPAFKLEKKGDCYMVRSESLTSTHEWILRNHCAEKSLASSAGGPQSTFPTVNDGALCYGPLDIARLDAREREKRDHRPFDQKDKADRLSELLRTLGDHLDSKGATAFEISWAADSVSVDYRAANGARERKDFTVEKLQQLALYARFRRSNANAPVGSR